MLKHEIVRITPKLATEYLERNKNNRPLVQGHVDRLAKDMLADRWKQDGAPIRFDKNDALLDGQHRLRAIIVSGVAQHMLVVTGLDPDSFQTMDSGRKRTTGDALHIQGEQYYTILAPAIALMVEYLKDGTLGRKGATSTTTELLDAFNSAPSLRESVRFVASTKQSHGKEKGTQSILLPLGLLASLHFLFAEKSLQLANDFVTGICNGFDLSTNPAFHRLRERLIGNQMSKAKLPREYLAAICIKSWNAERTKREMKQLGYADSEDFPVIR